MGSGITLASNEMKDMIKVIRSLDNRGISFKWTTKKAINKKGVFLSKVFGSLIRVCLPLMKNVLQHQLKVMDKTTCSLNNVKKNK